MTNLTRSKFQAHPFHLVSPSPWPICTSITLLTLTTTGVSTMHGFANAQYFFYIALITLVCSMSFWFRDIISESTYQGNHTLAVQTGLNMGVALFIVSEALFFLGIFWAFFHCSVKPLFEIGTEWSPSGLDSVDPIELPLGNTILLLCSGMTVTFAHHYIINGDRAKCLQGLVLTTILALVFTGLQAVEFLNSTFSIGDSIFACCFYFATGFHGLHVIIGTAFIGVGLWRVLAYHSTDNHHLGLESSILYWHFVDIVWIILFGSLYYWSF